MGKRKRRSNCNDEGRYPSDIFAASELSILFAYIAPPSLGLFNGSSDFAISELNNSNFLARRDITIVVNNHYPVRRQCVFNARLCSEVFWPLHQSTSFAAGVATGVISAGLFGCPGPA